MYSLERKNVKLLKRVKKLNKIAITKYKIIGKVSSLLVPAIEIIIIRNDVILNPLNAVPIVNFDTTDYDK